MALFRKKQKQQEQDDSDQAIDDMMSQLARMPIEELEDAPEVRHSLREIDKTLDLRAGMIAKHLEMVHMPGGLAKIKAAADFMELGAARPYLDALSDITFKIDEQLPTGSDIFTNWTVTGTHTGELCGIPPSGEQVTIHGVTMSVIRDGLIVTEYVYWDFPPVTEQLMAAAAS
jgi:predicted ester cyclase